MRAFDDLHQLRTVRAVVLAASGTAFCSGMDLAEMHNTSKSPDALAQWHHDAAAYRDLLEMMLRFPKPLIAAVNGPALAGGAGLALACDLVLATDAAAFGLPEPRRGLVAGMIAPLLAFRVGAGRAAYLLLSAQRFPLPRPIVSACITNLCPRTISGLEPTNWPVDASLRPRGPALDEANAQRDDRRTPDDDADRRGGRAAPPPARPKPPREGLMTRFSKSGAKMAVTATYSETGSGIRDDSDADLKGHYILTNSATKNLQSRDVPRPCRNSKCF